jgi:hypothetical protein
VLRRLLAGAAVTAALLTVSAGSTVHAAPHPASTDSPLRVVHVEMRCHTVGDHEPIT